VAIVRSEARFPGLAQGDGHYESFYLKLAAPGGGRALWIRHTVHKRPGAEPNCSIWFALFDASTGAPTAGKATFGADRLSVPAGSYIRVADAEVGPGQASGSIEIDELRASWDLRFSDRHEALRHLPADWMYRTSLPKTKLLSPHPGALYSGEVTVNGERIAIESWPGMVGHNWGAEHAERWVWLHGADFEGGGEGDYIDIGAGRIKLGRWTVPWIANGRLVLGGEAHQLGGLPRVRSTEVDATPGRCTFTVPGRGIEVQGEVTAPLERFVGWIYADPDGGEHNTINCSIADMELTVEQEGRNPRTLRVPAGAAYELGMRETDHGVPIQPYPDG
jgi:hypothetical protein